MDISKEIIENIANPSELERMYRKAPEAFKRLSYEHGKKTLIPQFLLFGKQD